MSNKVEHFIKKGCSKNYFCEHFSKKVQKDLNIVILLKLSDEKKFKTLEKERANALEVAKKKNEKRKSQKKK